MAVIALGKLGGNELNYSSDIDIVFAYPEDLVWVHVIAVALLWNAISWSFLAGGVGASAQVSDRARENDAPLTHDLVAS